MHGELINVPRKSSIFLRGKYFEYPLKPLNAAFDIGIPTTLRILGSYGIERVKRIFWDPETASLEDWVISHFGRTMFDIYFKEYSEKVWGIDCGRISAEWVDPENPGTFSFQGHSKCRVQTKRPGSFPTLVDSVYVSPARYRPHRRGLKGWNREVGQGLYPDPGRAASTMRVAV